MDLSQLFKACVKTIRLRSKSAPVPDKMRILKVKRDEFLIQAKNVSWMLTQLRDLLIENRSAYMRFGFHLKTSSQMTDEERNIIDMESEKIITICNQYLNNLQNECFKNRKSLNDQFFGHKMIILNLLYDYLKDVFHIHCEQKGNRTQHELDTYKLLKLELRKQQFSSNQFSDGLEKNHSINVINQTCGEKSNSTSCKNGNNSTLDFSLDDDQANKFSLDDENSLPDDIQVFESENMYLINTLKGYSDEVEQIEKNVVGISKLQNIFTEKVKMLLIYMH